MSVAQLILILVTVIAISVGQVLFKVAAGKLSFTLDGFFSSLFTPGLIAALFVYFVATVLWIIVLKQTPLRIAYPFVALAFVLVPMLAHWLLDEGLSWNTFAGAALITLGVWVSVFRV